jgi:hypothetical protein
MTISHPTRHESFSPPLKAKKTELFRAEKDIWGVEKVHFDCNVSFTAGPM